MKVIAMNIIEQAGNRGCRLQETQDSRIRSGRHPAGQRQGGRGRSAPARRLMKGVIGRAGGGVNQNFTVRIFPYGEGVEAASDPSRRLHLDRGGAEAAAQYLDVLGASAGVALPDVFM